MKALIFFLVLGNLLFYAFAAGFFGRPDNPDAGRVEQQVHPERLRIVSRGEPPAAAVKSGEPAAVEAPASEEAAPAVPGPSGEKAADKAVMQVADAAPAKAEAKVAETAVEAAGEKPAEKAAEKRACLLWTKLAPADADKLGSVIAQRFSGYKVDRRSLPGEGGGWWVHIPPLADKATQEKKMGELRELGVADFFPVPDGPAKLAISLGVFSTEKAAQDYLTSLRGKGVRSAKIGARPGKEALVRLETNGPATLRENVIAAAGKAVPGAEAQACQ